MLPNSDPLSDVRSGYDRWALVYDRDGNPLPALEEPFMQQAAGDVRGSNVLDLGCGTGRHSRWLATAGAHVTAVDFSNGMLAEAKLRPELRDVTFVVHDLHRPLPFADGSFDLVVSGLVLEHLSDLDLFFGQVHRVLRPGARAIISAMHPAMFLRGSQARFTDPESGEIIRPGSIVYQVGDFVMALLRAALTIDAIGEHAPDAELAARHPRADRYIGWPMLVLFSVRKGSDRPLIVGDK